MDDYITAKEFAEKWNCSVNTVRDWCRKGKLTEVRRPKKDRGKWLIPKDAVPESKRGIVPDKPRELVTK